MEQNGHQHHVYKVVFLEHYQNLTTSRKKKEKLFYYLGFTQFEIFRAKRYSN